MTLSRPWFRGFRTCGPRIVVAAAALSFPSASFAETIDVGAVMAHGRAAGSHARVSPGDFAAAEGTALSVKALRNERVESGAADSAPMPIPQAVGTGLLMGGLNADRHAGSPVLLPETVSADPLGVESAAGVREPLPTDGHGAPVTTESPAADPGARGLRNMVAWYSGAGRSEGSSAAADATPAAGLSSLTASSMRLARRSVVD